jgi:transglutaminase-like putative cysteine protease
LLVVTTFAPLPSQPCLAQNPFNQVMNAARNLFDRLASRVVRFTWKVDVAAQRRYQPKGLLKVPIPYEGRVFQTAVTTITGAPHRFVTQGDNRYAEVQVEDVGTFEITSTVTLPQVSYRAQAELAGWTFPESVRSYLRPMGSVDSDSVVVQGLAQTLRRPTYAGTVEEVLNWVNANMSYNGVGEAGGSTSVILQRRTGHCEGVTTAAVSLLRACGVPARFVRGHAGAWEKERITWHTILEYYIPGVGWVDWDHHLPPFQPCRGFLATFNYSQN